MLITKETDYALRILRALADGRRLTTAQLAQNEQIPQQFAYKILKKLQRGGLVRILKFFKYFISKLLGDLLIKYLKNFKGVDLSGFCAVQTEDVCWQPD